MEWSYGALRATHAGMPRLLQLKAECSRFQEAEETGFFFNEDYGCLGNLQTKPGLT